jgi:hypothetical protein
VLSPNRDNIYKHFFIASAGFAILSGILRLRLNWPVKDLMDYGIVPAALLMFILGLLTMLTRPRDHRRVAEEKAQSLMHKIAQSEIGHLLTSASTDVVQIAKLIASNNTSAGDLYKPLLDELYQMVSACELPRNYGEAERPLLDWHMYDLCIIVAKEDVDLANKIKHKLEAKDSELSVYVDVTDFEWMGQPTERFIRKVFYASSRKCLALLSIHSGDHERRKAELYEAMRRAQLPDVSCQDYLIPLPLDNSGLKYMKKDTFLCEYAEHIEVIRDHKKLSDMIIQKLSSVLPVHPGPAPGNDKPSPYPSPAATGNVSK